MSTFASAGVPGVDGLASWEQWANAPGYWSPTPDPHGQAVAMVSDRGGAPQVWVQRLDDLWAPREPRLLRTGDDHILSAAWSPDGQWIACLGAPGGNATRTRVWVVRPDGRDLRRVAGVRQGNAAMGPWVHTGSTLTITTTGRRPEENNSHLLRVGSWETFQLSYGFPFTVLALSHDGERALLRRGARGARQLVLVDLRTRHEHVLLPSAPGQTGTTEAAAFAPNGDVFALTDSGRERSALARIRVRGRKFDVETVADRDGEDLDSFVLSEDGRMAALVWNVEGRSQLELLDTATLQMTVPAPVPADVVDSCVFTRDGRRLLICAQGTAQPRSIWMVDVRQAAVDRPWRRARPGERAVPGADAFVTPSLERLTASDGTELTGWLYRARHADLPGPVVLHLHGGPEAQDRPTFSPLYQALVARGLTVFAPNVRGSTGYGKAFREADDVGGRFDAIGDVVSCVRHLVARGLADPARVACSGRSYGGYLTLAALAFHPELFAAGVDICGMSDLITFMRDTEPWISVVSATKYGSPLRDRALLDVLSPLRLAGDIRAPLLVVHGRNDFNVPLAESERIVDALRQRGGDVTFRVFEDEGHELHLLANKRAFVGETVDWLCGRLAAAGRSPMETVADSLTSGSARY